MGCGRTTCEVPLACLLCPRAHPPLRAGRRNEPILTRVRILALIFAVLTLL